MQHAVAVRAVEPAQDVLAQTDDHLGRDRDLLFVGAMEDVVEARPGEVLHHDEPPALAGAVTEPAEVVDGDDVGMVQARRDPSLGHEPGHRLGGLAVEPDPLEHDEAPEPTGTVANAEPDLAHATATELVDATVALVHRLGLRGVPHHLHVPGHEGARGEHGEGQPGQTDPGRTVDHPEEHQHLAAGDEHRRHVRDQGELGDRGHRRQAPQGLEQPHAPHRRQRELVGDRRPQEVVAGRLPARRRRVVRRDQSDDVDRLGEHQHDDPPRDPLAHAPHRQVEHGPHGSKQHVGQQQRGGDRGDEPERHGAELATRGDRRAGQRGIEQRKTGEGKPHPQVGLLRSQGEPHADVNHGHEGHDHRHAEVEGRKQAQREHRRHDASGDADTRSRARRAMSTHAPVCRPGGPWRTLWTPYTPFHALLRR